MSTTDESVICVINKSEPPYQPNIYLCSTDSYCCTYLGQSACCDNDISFHNVIVQAWPIALMFLCFLLFAGLVDWYFSDDESMYDFDKDRTKRAVIGMLYPTNENEMVDDPLFGPLYDEKVPRKAYVSASEEQANESTPEPSARPILDEC